jgi:hypothetical protein
MSRPIGGSFYVCHRHVDPGLRAGGGGGGIRTLETLARLPVFKTGAFNRSATPPCQLIQMVIRCPDSNKVGIGHDLSGGGNISSLPNHEILQG